MVKIHIEERFPWAICGIPENWQDLGRVWSTSDPEKVTCKHCLRWLARRSASSTTTEKLPRRKPEQGQRLAPGDRTGRERNARCPHPGRG